MKSVCRLIVLALAVACIVGAALPVWASQTSEGQVVVVQENTLYIRTSTGEPMSFSPYFVYNGRTWVAAKPASTVLPALESGEWVKVEWTMDERERRRRIDSIGILRATTGTTIGTVVSSSASQLVIRPKDKPGTVTMNPGFVQREGRWIPDPAIASKLVNLPKGTVVTVAWSWDQEGRKRITSLALGAAEQAPVGAPTAPQREEGSGAVLRQAN